MMKNKKVNYIILFIAISFVLFFSLKDDFKGVIYALLKTNVSIFIISILIVILSIFLKSISYLIFFDEEYNDFSIKKVFKMTLIGQFLNGITPFQSGGQPFLIYMLKKEGKKVSDTSIVFLKDQLSYQIAIIFLSFICFILNKYLNIFNNGFINLLITIGFLVNIFVLVIILLITKSKKYANKIADFIINKIFDIKFLNKFKKKEKDLRESINNFYDAGLRINKNKSNFILSIIFNILNIIMLYSIPFFVILSLGYKVDIIYSIVATSFIMLIGNFIPIPGASGGIEYSFMCFIGALLSGSVLTTGMLLWRFITYVIPVMLGFILFVKKGSDKI